MGTTVVKRPGRRPAPALPAGELMLEAPPEIPAPAGRSWQQVLTFLPMLAIMAAMLLMFSGSMSGSLRLIVFALFGVAMLGMVVASLLGGGGAGRQEMAQARRRYLRGLAQHRARLVRSVAAQRTALLFLHPDPSSLWALTSSRRLWERRYADPDFAVTRIGLGPQSPAMALIAPDTKPLEQLEPLSALALRRFLTTYRTIPELPLAVALTGFGRVHVCGDRERRLGLVRAMLAQLASLHAPEDLRIAVCAAASELPTWDWVKWLPHALHPERCDGAGPVRLVATSVPGIEAMLDEALRSRPRFDPDSRRGTGPHLVVVLDGAAVAGSDHLMTGGGVEGVTIIDLAALGPRLVDRSALSLDVEADGALSALTFDGPAELGRADLLDTVTAEALARTLAPMRLRGGARGEQALHSDLGLADLLELGDPYTFDPDAAWAPRPNRDRLRVMFGVEPDGAGVELDLKESAQDGMGPHGLLIGATGSGKSELLRTLVLGLACTHPPSALNFVLIDFKGGATFSKLDALPHTSAVITNLADELPLVDRMTDALNGELVRRQELLRAAGSYSSLRDYERARAAGVPLPEVPTLLVICDEFSELLSAKPDFIDTFVTMGRVGRSLGVHLLLASQRLEEGRLRGLDTHLSYRIGLRTFSAAESQSVLGVRDAYELPRAPGHGYLRFGTEPLTRLRAAYVSGVHHRPGDPAQRAPEAGPALLEFSTAYVGAPRSPDADPDTDTDTDTDTDDSIGESLLDILVERLRGRGVPAHPVWLPPLADAPSLAALLGPPELDPQRGLVAGGAELAGALRVVAGVVDRPYEQRRDLLEFDLSGAAGHLLLIGGPRSGKSTALRTVVTALALTHTPAEAQFYGLDFGGGGLAPLRGLPHVGGIATRQNAGAVRRTVAQVAGVLAERERRFAEHEVEGIDAYRRARAAGQVLDDPYGEVFLVVDGWQTLHAEFPDAEATVCDLAARGLAYGVHVLVTCARAFDLRPAVRDLFASRAELRLGDPIDSTIDRMAALNVPAGAPGRGIGSCGHQVLFALPRTDLGSTDIGGTDGLSEATATLVARIADAWPGPAAPAVRLLPTTLPYAELPAPAPSGGVRSAGGLRVPIGIAEEDLGPVTLDFAADPHALLLGDARSGKTAFLRLIARQITRRYTPAQARLILVDHRRGLAGDVNPEHLLGYGTDLARSRELIAEVARGMAERMPGPDVTPDRLRRRDWWSGPELFVLVDDYDLVAGIGENPLRPLLEYLPQGREIGLHVVLTRRSGGAGRGLFEAFLAQLRDAGSPGLLLSGSRDEGPLLGGCKPEPLPPGRGRLITRDGTPQLVQLAWLAPTEIDTDTA